MSKVASFISLGIISLNKNTGTPLHRQIYERLYEAIISGQLKPGTRLPSVRALAQELGISRNTAAKAYAQLLAEGYLESKVGSGTCVTSILPEDLLYSHPRPNGRTQTSLQPEQFETRPRLSDRGQAIAQIPFLEHSPTQAFSPGLPAVDVFPFKLWEKLLVKCWRELPFNRLGYPNAKGYRSLREAVAGYLRAARGVRCAPEQIIITNGAQQAISLAVNVLLNPGDDAWVENPSYNGIKAALNNAQANIVPVPVDGEGFVVDEALARTSQARLAYISPSHQYPLGVTMSLARRLQLLQWAQESDGWILEDDYDSEYRYSGYPLAALQGLDKAGRVIYMGTFSKVLFPALRLGYMVVPPALIEPFRAARAHADRGASLLEQAVVARFITEGHFARHIRRMRTLYLQRQHTLVEAARVHLRGLLQVEPHDAGLHLIGWLPQGVDDAQISRRLAGHGIDMPPLSSYAIRPLARAGLVMGYTSMPEHKIIIGVKQMSPILAECLAGQQTAPRPVK